MLEWIVKVGKGTAVTVSALPGEQWDGWSGQPLGPYRENE